MLYTIIVSQFALIPSLTEAQNFLREKNLFSRIFSLNESSMLKSNTEDIHMELDSNYWEDLQRDSNFRKLIQDSTNPNENTSGLRSIKKQDSIRQNEPRQNIIETDVKSKISSK